MAILSSPFEDRHGTESAQPAKGRRRSLVVDWLAHPQASFYLVLVPAVLLLVLGMMMVLSASSVYAYVRWDGDSYYFVKRQAVFLLVGGAMAYVFARLQPTQLKVLGWVLMAAAMILQVLTFSPLGYSNNGNTNWVNLGFSWFNIQPSEVAKLAIVMWGADIFARKEKLLGDVRHLLIPFLPASLVMIGLVVLQSDLGTGMILGAIMLSVLWYVGASWKVLVSIIGGVAAAVVVLILTAQYRMSRILGFFNPNLDPLGINHQPIRAQFALASGGWWGLGLGESRQKWAALSSRTPTTSWP